MQGILNELVNLPGPQFLGVFALIAVASIIVGIGLRLVASGPFGAFDPRMGELSPHEVAGLEGRGRGIMTAVLMALMRGGHVVLDHDRHWKRGPAPGRGSVGDRRMLEYLDRVHRRLPEEQSFTIEAAIEASRSELDEVIETLVRHGLLIGSFRRFLSVAIGLLPMGAAVVLGIAKIGVGVNRDRPVGFLVGEVLLVVLLAVIFAAAGQGRTVRGWRHLASRRSAMLSLRSSASADASRLAADDLALAVSLYGTTVLQGSAFSEAAAATLPPKPQVTSDGGSGSGCGSSGCGGGGGGGGCGGCGG